MGLAKQLVEEIYPLAIFAYKKYGEKKKVYIKPVIGNQNYDAILTDDSHSPPLVKYVEVTQSHEGETEYLRAFYLQKHGYVPLTGKIKKGGSKKSGLRISAELEAVPVIENANNELQRIVDAIERKESKRYPNNTCLVISFDDGYMFRRALDITEIDTRVKNKILGHNFCFDEIYLVGRKKGIFRQYKLIRSSREIIQVKSM